ncbi:hypothetical protein B0H14DRAFT_3466267 [Mycena olivaceomarginata]|nr:hypothetical protein B0H14DRAFT_3466267 [Mycena olivaceomarginata]
MTVLIILVHIDVGSPILLLTSGNPIDTQSPPSCAKCCSPPASTVYYAVGGGAIVHSDLTSALAQFTAMSSRGPAELLTTEDARQATHFASGFPQRASDMWLGHDPPDWTHLSDMARC